MLQFEQMAEMVQLLARAKDDPQLRATLAKKAAEAGISPEDLEAQTAQITGPGIPGANPGIPVPQGIPQGVPQAAQGIPAPAPLPQIPGVGGGLGQLMNGGQ